MAGFANVQALGDALLAGQSTYATWRKSPSQASTAGVWFDLSMSPGNPAPQYYAASPLVAKTLTQSGDGGLFHGGAVSPASKHLSRVTALTSTATALPMPMILCDYLLFYPFVDEGSTDEQLMDNTTTLPRYTDGEGVQVMAVSVAGRTGGVWFERQRPSDIELLDADVVYMGGRTYEVDAAAAADLVTAGYVPVPLEE